MQRIALLFVLLSGGLADAMADVTVENSRMYPRLAQGDRVYAGELKLPGEERWLVKGGGKDTGSIFYLSPDRSDRQAEVPGQRLGLVAARRKNRQGEYLLRQFYQALRQHALDQGKPPRSLEELGEETGKRLMAKNENAWKQEPVSGPYAFLLPGAEFIFAENSPRVEVDKRQLLMVELQPYLDDGKHWRLYTDGSCKREAIDPALVKRYRLAINPVTSEQKLKVAPEEKSYDYRILTRLPSPPASTLELRLESESGGRSIPLIWDMSQAVSDPGVVEELQQARLATWRGYAAAAADNLALRTWLESIGGKAPSAPRRGAAERGNTSSLFNLLGGRAAVQETLQLQPLSVNAGSKQSPADIDISTLQGVEVTSHPFAEMLQELPDPKTLPLADIVPRDRFFLYAKPDALLGFLDRGTEFLHGLDGLFSGGTLDYNLKQRYLQRLGLSEIWLTAFLQSGSVTEAAVILPDLFLIDGTEITVAARLATPDPLPPLLLRGIGLGSLAEGSVVTRRLADERQVFWALKGDLLLCSSSRQELDALLALEAQGGAGSLGRSAEFRYMLQKLPPQENTRLYAYLSDPFLRGLLSAKTKIAQLRRLQARRDLEQLTGSALLAKMDGMDDPASLQRLVDLGYAPARLARRDYSLSPQLQARSQRFGTLADLTPLSRLDVPKVTRQEAAAYQSYVENYSRFWSRFFDPIALRLNDRADGALEATTFILPLIENSIYEALRDTLVAADEQRPLRMPVVEPRPLAMLSFNLDEESLLDGIGKLHGVLRKFTYVQPALFDDLGPSVHLAVHDADPVIALGGSDLLGVFDSRFIGSRGFDTFLIPAALSLLTRPCTLYIETRSPARTRTYLQQAVFFRSSRNTGINGNIYQVGEGDNWIASFNFMGLVRLRFGLGIEGDFLTIKNIPWGKQGQLRAAASAPFNGASLRIAPGAARQQLPALFNAAQEQERKTAMQGLSYLYPILASGYADIEEAARAHRRLFGFAPEHPQGGDWLWQGNRVASSRYGSLYRQKQPPYTATADDFGPLRDIDGIDLNMQLEESGLRASVVWKLKEPPIKSEVP